MAALYGMYIKAYKFKKCNTCFLFLCTYKDNVRSKRPILLVPMYFPVKGKSLVQKSFVCCLYIMLLIFKKPITWIIITFQETEISFSPGLSVLKKKFYYTKTSDIILI